MKIFATAMLTLGAAFAALHAPAVAADRARTSAQQAVPGGAHRASPAYRRGPQVRGFVQKRGGYSFSAGDTINTYGDSRTNFGGANVFRDGRLDGQTFGGPFDHGFFFDSGTAPRGGNSPYMN